MQNFSLDIQTVNLEFVGLENRDYAGFKIIEDDFVVYIARSFFNARNMSFEVGDKIEFLYRGDIYDQFTPVDAVWAAVDDTNFDHTLWVDNFAFTDSMLEVYHFAMQDMLDEGVSSILISGPSGTGKTDSAKMFAKYLCSPDAKAIYGHDFDMLHFVEDAHTKRVPGSLLVDMAAENGNTVMYNTQFIEAVMQGNRIVVVDELSRVLPDVYSSLFPLMDDRRVINYRGREFKVGPNVIFVSTENKGWRHTGTTPVDAALRQRHRYHLKMGFLPFELEQPMLVAKTGIDEKRAGIISRALWSIRENTELQGELNADVSQRIAISVAKTAARGNDLGRSFAACFLNDVNDDLHKRVADILNLNEVNVIE